MWTVGLGGQAVSGFSPPLPGAFLTLASPPCEFLAQPGTAGHQSFSLLNVLLETGGVRQEGRCSRGVMALGCVRGRAFWVEGSRCQAWTKWECGESKGSEW